MPGIDFSHVFYGNTDLVCVKQYQQALIDRGFSIPAGATGYFGDQTKAATEAWLNAGTLRQLGFTNVEHTSTGGRITTDQIDFTGKGQWASGGDACRGYVRTACGIAGRPSPYWETGMTVIAGRESAFNSPQWQVNTTDLNAKNVPELYGGGPAPDGYPGQCSRGGWQCIPQTFAKHHQAGTSNKIYDPVASVAAAMNYVIAVYGVSPDGHDLAQKVQQADPNRPPKGY